MNISGQVIEIFDYLGEKLGLAIDWGSENVLPYIKVICENVVKYNIVISIVEVVVGLTMVIACVFFARTMVKSYKRCKAEKSDTTLCEYYKYFDGDVSISPNTFGIVGMCVSGVVSMFGMCFTISGFSDLLKWVFIPEISLIEYITGFVSQL